MREFRFPTITLPVWDAITWITVLGMVAVVFGLFLAGLFATLAYSTPSVELPLALSILGIFVGVMALRLVVAAIRHFAPAEPLTPSLAVLLRGKPELDGLTKTIVFLLGLCVTGLFFTAILATYTYSTPGALLPVLVISLASAIVAIAIKLVDVTVRHFSGK